MRSAYSAISNGKRRLAVYTNEAMSFFLMFLITIVDSVAVSYLTKRSFGRTAAFVNLSFSSEAFRK